MNKTTKGIYLIILLSSLSLCLSAQTPHDSTVAGPPGYSPLLLRPVNALIIDSNDNKWVAFSKIGLGKLNDAGWTIYDSLNSPLPDNNILSVACNSSGVWAGTNNGLYNFDGTTWTSYTTSNSSLPFDTISKLYSVNGGGVWIFANNGFVYFDGSSFHSYNTSNSGLVNDSVECIFRSSSNVWWIGTRHGLSLFNGVLWTNYTIANSALCGDDITSIIEDNNNTLFVGTRVDGLFIKSSVNTFMPAGSYINEFYGTLASVEYMLSLSDGSILVVGAGSQYDTTQYFISTNPIHVIPKSIGLEYLYNAKYFLAIDKSNRIWRRSKNNFSMFMKDSLNFYPEVVVPLNYSSPSHYNYLDINEVECPIQNDNAFFWDKINNVARYMVPKNSCVPKAAAFNSTLWIGGLDPGNNIHMSAQTYRQSGNDWWPGPLDTITASLDANTKMQFDTIWKINRSAINEFVLQYNLGNVSNHTYVVPNEILLWPAHGTANYAKNMAPFIDHNNDGVYNPYDGDYPDMMGDQMLWWIMNDNYAPHHETGGIALGLEVRCKAYAFTCGSASGSDEAINYTTFYSFEFINRSDTDYHNVYVGEYLDPDLGYANNDYIGCRVENDYGFVYNGSNYDEGPVGYGYNPPMLSLAILKGPLADVGDGLDNNHNGVTDEPDEKCMMNHFLYYENDFNATGNPRTAEDYYNYLHSLWLDGNHVTYGGDGYGGSVNTDYMFTGMPFDTGWTEASVTNLPGDRRLLISSGPFSLDKKSSKTLDYAVVYSRDALHPNGLTTSIEKNNNDVLKIKNWYKTTSFPCYYPVGIKEEMKNTLAIEVYPNPVNKKLTILNQGLSIRKIKIYDLFGQLQDESTRNEIDVSNLSPGIYFLELQTENGNFVKKFVKE